MNRMQSNVLSAPNQTRRRRPRRTRGQRARRRRNAPQRNRGVERKLPLEGSGPITRVTRQPFPDRMIVSQVLESTLSASAGGTFIDTAISGNSAFDPLQAFGSAQPAGFDQWAAIYNEYRVLRSRVTAVVVGGDSANVGTLNACRVILAAAPKNVSSVFGSLDDLTSTQYATETVETTVGSPTPFRTPWMSTAKMFGYTSAEFDYDGSAAVSANPVDEWFWHIGASIDQKVAGTGITTLDFRLRWEAEVEFFVRDSQGLSLEKRLANNREAHEQYTQLKKKTHDGTGRLPKKTTYLEKLALALEQAEVDTVLVRQEHKAPVKTVQTPVFTFGKQAK